MVSPYRQIGFHDHHANNIVGLSAAISSGIAASGVLPSGTLPPGGTQGQVLSKASPADFDVEWHDIEYLSTAEMDDTLVLAPDGAGGVEFRAETSGGAFVGARVYKSTDFSHNSSGNYLAITFNTERYDTSAIHDTGSNTTRLTAPSTGYYHIGGCIQWDSNSTGNRILGIRRNGTDYICLEGNLPSASRVQNVSCDYFLSSGDYVELVAFQGSGGTRSIIASTMFSPEFWIHLIGA